MIITGGEFRPDSLKPKEVVSLLLDDEEMEARCKYRVPLIKMTEYLWQNDLYENKS